MAALINPARAAPPDSGPMAVSAPVSLQYLGWSGFRLCTNHCSVLIDPPWEGVPEQDPNPHFVLTHGHPEHLAGVRTHVQRVSRPPAQIWAAPALCRYLQARSVVPQDRFHPCADGDHLECADFTLDVFTWTHMPLLPPGPGASLRHVAKILGRPALAARIIAASLRGPAHGPMLGYRISAPGAPTLLVYGEGLHRKADAVTLGNLARRLPADLLLAAVEPEDLEILPELIGTALQAQHVVLYQPHQPWRQAFGMPLADVETLADELRNRAIHARVAGKPGDHICEPWA